MKKKNSLRIKLTIINIVIITITCLILTTISSISAQKVIDTIPLTPTFPSQDTYPFIEITPSQIITQAAKKKFNYNITIYMFIIILSGGTITYFVTKKAMQPLEMLKCQIENININNLSENIEISNADIEIKTITDSFNLMTNKLSHSFDMQKRFSQNAAHELRTPLAIMKTKLDVFKKKDNRSIDEYNQLIDTMQDNTKRLTSVVESLLNLTNYDNTLLNDKISLDKIINIIVHDLQHLANEKNIDIVYNNTNVNLTGNETLLYRAFFNIIENAIKYNSNNTKIEITVKSNIEHIFISISDNGIGISDEHKQNVFEPFYRIDKSRSRQISGTGLGLSIANEIIKTHNGKIDIYDNIPNGTTFVISLVNLKE